MSSTTLGSILIVLVLVQTYVGSTTAVVPTLLPVQEARDFLSFFERFNKKSLRRLLLTQLRHFCQAPSGRCHPGSATPGLAFARACYILEVDVHTRYTSIYAASTHAQKYVRTSPQSRPLGIWNYRELPDNPYSQNSQARRRCTVWYEQRCRTQRTPRHVYMPETRMGGR